MEEISPNTTSTHPISSKWLQNHNHQQLARPSPPPLQHSVIWPTTLAESLVNDTTTGGGAAAAHTTTTTLGLPASAAAAGAANTSVVLFQASTSGAISHGVRSAVIAAATAVVDEASGPVRLSRKRSLCEIATSSSVQPRQHEMSMSKPVVRILSAPRITSLRFTPHHSNSAKANEVAAAVAPTKRTQSNAAAECRPVDILMSILQSSSSSTMASRDTRRVLSFHDIPSDFYSPFTVAEMDAYGSDVLGAIRSQDLDALRQFHKSGKPLKCSNRFGESLLHLACRKGFADVVDMLINEAGVTLRVKDDFGRNPAHDACWTVEPNFQLMDLIVGSCPDLLLVKDVRGHTPLDYVRREHWPAWSEYLMKKGEQLSPKILSY